MPPRELTREQARRIYDRIGARQDSQAFYEDRAAQCLIANGGFAAAHRVLELGCGTGRFAAELLARHLPADARYRGLDLSPKMIGLARERLARFADRAEVVLSDGSPPVSEPAASRDRFVATFVLDLLPERDIEAVLREAHRILVPDGRLCVASLSSGIDPLSRLVARAWSTVHALWPPLVGGCRPLELLPRLASQPWRVVHHARIAPFGIPIEVVLAERR